MATVEQQIGFDEPAELYHQRSGAWLSSHLLQKFVKSPALYYSTIKGEEPKVDSTAYAFGRACHVYILEGVEAFEREFSVGAPVNPKTSKPYGAKTKAFAAWAKEQELTPVHTDDHTEIQKMAETVSRHAGAKAILADGAPERVIRRKYCGLPCQIRMDWVQPSGDFADLKTCWDYDFFQDDFFTYCYPSQLAFYRAILRLEILRTPDVHVIATEKNGEHRCGAWKISTQILDKAEQENREAIEKLKRCISSNRYPLKLEDV